MALLSVMPSRFVYLWDIKPSMCCPGHKSRAQPFLSSIHSTVLWRFLPDTTVILTMENMGFDRGLVLITGVTGHVGFRVLIYALNQGYYVRAIVRSEAKSEGIRSTSPLKSSRMLERLSLEIIPDFGISGAFDRVMQDVQFVIHCAAPMPYNSPFTDNANEEYVRPAVDSTLNILQSANRFKTVQRIVITSSCIAVVPVDAALSGSNQTFSAKHRQPTMTGTFDAPTPALVAYAAAKVATLNRTEVWVETAHPSFDIIHLMPSYVIGRKDLCSSITDLEASPNRFLLRIATGLGGDDVTNPAVAMVVNHVKDCARIHVEALNPAVTGNNSFMIDYGVAISSQWNDVRSIVKDHFPDAVAAGILPNQGNLDSVQVRLNSAETERTFGFRHTFEEAVVSAIEQYLELHEENQKKNQV